MGHGNIYISCNYSCTIPLLVEILLVNLKCLYIQYVWISIMKKQKSNQNVKVEKIVVLVKTFWPFPWKVSTFPTVLQNFKGIWNWNLNRNLIMTLLIILTLLMFKIMRSLRSSKYLKTSVELTFTTQKSNACSPCTAYSVFNWNYLFWVILVQKLKIISLSWNFVSRLIQICRIPWRCSLFLFSTGKTFLGKFGPKNKNCQFVLKFRTRRIWICRIMKKTCGVHFFCFRPEKPFLDKSSQKIKIFSLSWNLVPRLLWISRIQWWCSIFLFLNINIFLGQIWSKNSKLFVRS